MTGFGIGEGETTLGKVVVEIRSVNHRYCDISLKLPRRLNPLEGRIKEMVRAEVARGRVDVFVRLDAKGEGKVQFDVDLSLAEQYFKALQILIEKFGLKGEISLEHLTGAKDLITAKEAVEDVESCWVEIASVLKQAVHDMDRMKQNEGAVLGRDVGQRLDRIAQLIEEVRIHFPLTLKAYQERLKERLRTLLDGTELDPGRFRQEIAYWLERTDITEEMVRAESHLAQFRALLVGAEPVGRKMDFLLQEIHREVNTISSKANEARVSQKVVEVKSELEKIREQVQNIE
jgi:uncharacterized protein (TIGR00255 family)